MKKLFNGKILIMKDSELTELKDLIYKQVDKVREHNNRLINQNWNQKVEIRNLEQLLKVQKYKIMNLKSQLTRVRKKIENNEKPKRRNK